MFKTGPGFPISFMPTGDPSVDPRFDEIMEQMPEREVFVKDANGDMVGTGMLLLEDNSLLAPEGFSTESGSINFGDLVTLSEASGFLAIQNNINGQRYRLIDHWVPKDQPSAKPGYIHMYEGEHSFQAQPIDTDQLNSNPLIFSYTTQLTSRVNSITFKAYAAMQNVRIRIIDVSSGTVVKYLPTKAAWSQNEGGINLVVGDNLIDFKDTPLLFTPNTELRYEIYANSVALLGSPQGQPCMSAMVQRGLFKYLANEDEIPTKISQLTNDTAYITEADVPSKTSELENDQNFITAQQVPVRSVNGMQGDVTLSIPQAQIQADWNQSNTQSLDFIKNKPSIPASQLNSDWSSSSGVTAILNKPTTLSGYGITDAVTSSQLSTKYNTPTGTTSQYVRGDGSLATFPAIPTVSYPVLSVNNKTGVVVLSTTDVGEGINQYFTNARVQSYLAANGFRRVETFQGTTNASGDYAITFANTYATPPDVQAQIFPNTNANQSIRVTSITTTGCNIRVEQRNAATVLSLEVLLAAVVPVNGASVSVQVTPRA